MMPSSMADAVLFHLRRVGESRRSERLLPASASRESGSLRMSLDAGPRFTTSCLGQRNATSESASLLTAAISDLPA